MLILKFYKFTTVINNWDITQKNNTVILYTIFPDHLSDSFITN
jgi:hypothetical protein